MARPPRWLVVTPVLGALALGAAGVWFYLAQRQYLQQTASANLLAVTQAKLDQIVAWRTKRLGDAAVLQESPFFVRAVARWLAGRQPEIAAEILTRLRSNQDHYRYDDVDLVDRAGRLLLSTTGRTGGLDSAEAGALRIALRDRHSTMGDVLDSADDSIPRLAVVAPLFTLSARTSELLGAVVHVVDARRSLFRLVASWPGPSPSAEAVLVRRDGDSVLFLTARRFQPGAALNLRIPLRRTDVPAVMAVLGTEGIVRGVDYRGVRVISALRAVPGTPWFLVAKVDEAEALAVWRTRVALVFAVLLGLVLVAAATAIAVGQRSAKAHYRRLYEAEAALSASEARFRTLVEEAGDGFALLDAEGRYLDVNSACCRQLGYARDDLLRLGISDVDTLFTAQQFAADFQSLLGKPPVTYESVHRRKDGTTFPVEVTLSIVRIGGVPQALSLARDITERKRAEEALREKEQELRILFEELPVGVCLLDQNRNITYANPRLAEILGLSRDDLLQGRHQERRYLRSDGTPMPPEEYASVRAFQEQRPIHAVETGVVVEDGRTIWTSVSAAPFPVANEGVLIATADITERKRAEEALKESEAKYRNLIEQAWDAIYVVDRGGKILLVNEQACLMLGYTQAELAQLNVADTYPAEERAAMEERLAKAQRGQHSRYERSMVRKDGTTLPVEVTIGMLPNGLVQGIVRDVTERKRAEEALRESEERFRLAIHATFNAVWDWNLQTDALWWNENFQALFGYAAEEIEPGIESWKNRIHPEDLDRVTAGIHAAIDSGRQYWSDQYRVRRKDGSYAVVDDRGYITRTANGIPVRMLGAMQDITERKRAEEALRDSEVRYRTILATALDGFWLADMQGRLLEVNEAYSRMSGYSRQELLAIRISDLEAMETHAETAARIERIGTHGADRFESRHRRKDGSVYDVDISVQFQPMEGGRMVVIVRDITERKRAEEALRESEERHRSIIEQLNDAYYRTDRDGFITMVSPSAAHLFGFPSTSELIGRPIESLWQDPSGREALLAALGERGFVRDFEGTAVRADGTPFAVAVSSHYVRDPSGAADGVEGIIRDITERKQTEAALRALARHLDSVREEEHTRMARQIHDELGQALTALRLDLTWVGRKIPKGNTALRRRIDAAVALTDETITVGQRIVGELRPPILDDLGLVPAIEWYAQHFAKRSGLHIEVDLGAKEPVVPGHLAVTAYRIVQEALTNVARHAQATHVRVRLGEQDGTLTIEIRDDGRGFPEEAIRSPHSFGIVGMRERAASRGGELVITSSPGAGTAVRVTFPLERWDEPRVPR